ncbi:hypothetical protein O181_063956 [Austropuccinia psidii MF-1]|uniref:Uncharacterized protein n=1 Tax=Austropuccinia psidii MF-1 TaxID=1389203 RepID=A0A9Q3ESR5_9BASI|nr:hypothetical protein [Austropuccinia psidii MF-1]
MRRDNLLRIISVFIHLLSGLDAADQQKCGTGYYELQDRSAKNMEVMCENAGGHFYKCPFKTCRTPQGISIEKTLYFMNCRERQTNAIINVVWPTLFLANNTANSLTVNAGKKSKDLHGTKESINMTIDCYWRHWYEQNAVRPTCSGCR